MKTKLKVDNELLLVSLLMFMVAIILYLSYFVINDGVPKTEPIVPFIGLKINGISRFYDLIIMPILILVSVYLVQYIRDLEAEKFVLYRNIKIYLATIIVLTFLVITYIGLIAGLIACLLLCFIFGIWGGVEFGIIIGLLFGILAWISFSIKIGLIMGFIPGLIVLLITYSMVFLGLDTGKILKKY